MEHSQGEVPAGGPRRPEPRVAPWYSSRHACKIIRRLFFVVLCAWSVLNKCGQSETAGWALMRKVIQTAGSALVFGLRQGRPCSATRAHEEQDLFLCDVKKETARASL